MVVFYDHERVEGYLNPLRVRDPEPLDLLTVNGEHKPLSLKNVRAIYFVREFNGAYEPERKAFLSRPKLEGLWVRLKFKDNETLEGVVPNDLLALLDSGVQITPPDLNGSVAPHVCAPRSPERSLRFSGWSESLAENPPRPPLPNQNCFPE